MARTCAFVLAMFSLAARAGQAPGGASAPDIPVSGRDRGPISGRHPTVNVMPTAASTRMKHTTNSRVLPNRLMSIDLILGLAGANVSGPRMHA